MKAIYRGPNNRYLNKPLRAWNLSIGVEYEVDLEGERYTVESLDGEVLVDAMGSMGLDDIAEDWFFIQETFSVEE